MMSLMFCCSVVLAGDQYISLDNLLKRRPSEDKLIYDYAGILSDAQEYTQRYLLTINKQFQIEALVVSVPSLDGQYTIQSLATEIFESWRIGENYNGRGILLLLANEEKQVKLEVSMELEDVFTDAFTGYAEDMQLRPYFTSGQIGVGLIAVMEEIEIRAQLKDQGGYTVKKIVQLDTQFLSQGAGAVSNLKEYSQSEVSKGNWSYPAGATPEDAWRVLVQTYRDKVRDPNLGVYTEIGKLAFEDYQNLTDSYYEGEYKKYRNKEYQILRDKDYAVVYFGNNDGWENAPFLLSRTEEGWKFDLSHQRKYVRMGQNPKWGIERADYPHMELLALCPYFQGQDIPLDEGDIYHTRDDKAMALEIRRLLKDSQANPNDFNTLMELGRLATITSYSRNRIQWLTKAKQLRPDDPRPYKYLAISHVDMFYQYQAAITELKEYIKRAPQDIFAYKFLGYCYLKTKRLGDAVQVFEKALQLRPKDVYAQCKLARAYGQLFLQAYALDPRKSFYKKAALVAYFQAQESAPEHRRVRWLKQWLQKKGIWQK